MRLIGTFKLVTIAIICVMAVAGCAHYKTTLTNAQGETVTCEASGKSGIVTGYYLRKGFEECVTAAKNRGFKEITTTNPKPQ